MCVVVFYRLRGSRAKDGYVSYVLRIGGGSERRERGLETGGCRTARDEVSRDISRGQEETTRREASRPGSVPPLLASPPTILLRALLAAFLDAGVRSRRKGTSVSVLSFGKRERRGALGLGDEVGGQPYRPTFGMPAGGEERRVSKGDDIDSGGREEKGEKRTRTGKGNRDEKQTGKRQGAGWKVASHARQRPAAAVPRVDAVEPKPNIKGSRAEYDGIEGEDGGGGRPRREGEDE
ncbi:hypothetical protein K438DRAFT_1791849 [Mycena galopus ATCC 62051]|nr:hypothetical protein K438DRAFT_1791849 [Mycena galopus ATCC 62051]